MTLGAEGLKNYGIQGDGSRTPLYTSIFALYQPQDIRLWSYGRVDLLQEKKDVKGQRFLAGLGVPLQKNATSMQGRIWISWEAERLAEQMALYSGSGTLQKKDTIFFQFTGNLSTLLQESK